MMCTHAKTHKCGSVLLNAVSKSKSSADYLWKSAVPPARSVARRRPVRRVREQCHRRASNPYEMHCATRRVKPHVCCMGLYEALASARCSLQLSRGAASRRLLRAHRLHSKQRHAKDAEAHPPKSSGTLEECTKLRTHSATWHTPRHPQGPGSYTYIHHNTGNVRAHWKECKRNCRRHTSPPIWAERTAMQKRTANNKTVKTTYKFVAPLAFRVAAKRRV
jgi:hypothetical protein